MLRPASGHRRADGGARLDIPHYVVDEIGAFQRDVIDYFVAEYRQGRTPIPVLYLATRKSKFGTLLEQAEKLGAKFIANGHYGADRARYALPVAQGSRPGTRINPYFSFFAPAGFNWPDRSCRLAI